MVNTYLTWAITSRRLYSTSQMAQILPRSASSSLFSPLPKSSGAFRSFRAWIPFTWPLTIDLVGFQMAGYARHFGQDRQPHPCARGPPQGCASLGAPLAVVPAPTTDRVIDRQFEPRKGLQGVCRCIACLLPIPSFVAFFVSCADSDFTLSQARQTQEN